MKLWTYLPPNVIVTAMMGTEEIHVAIEAGLSNIVRASEGGPAKIPRHQVFSVQVAIHLNTAQILIRA